MGCGSGNNDSTSKSASSNKNGHSRTIKKSGEKLKIGVKEDIPNFGYMNPDTNKKMKEWNQILHA
ncbi:hypothetical protein JG559_10070 [Enterococcus faecalis]|uniref:Uncharacterized protein n=1 Tax=Enterococcus faecalis TaxID=1351 RepID=A0A974NZJ8_ENTFL|nr:hypothetical protein JG559_10070 [Enterococcus faecalis]